MESLAQAEHYEGKEASSEKSVPSDHRDEGSQLSSGVVSSTQDDIVTGTKRSYYVDENHEADPAEDEVIKRKKRKDLEDKELMGKPAPVSRSGTGRVLTGSKPPGPASRTGASSLGKGSSHSSGKGSSGSGSKGSGHSHGKSSGSSKSQSGHSKSGSSKGSGHSGKQDRKSPSTASKNQGKDTGDGDEDQKIHEAAPKVPPLKIVIPGGAGGSGGRNEQEGEGGTQRGGGKGRGSSTLPYVIPCTSTEPGQTSDSSDGIEDKRHGEGTKPGQRVLRSHRANDGDKERISPQTGHNQALHSNKSPLRSGSSHDHDHHHHHHHHHHASSTSGKEDVHPRKRKLKSSKESHSRDKHHDHHHPDSTTVSHNITHCNPYQLYIHIRKQVERRQRALIPVKPKPPKDFNKYLMNRCTYTLQQNIHSEPQIEIPINLPNQMLSEFMDHEKERTRLRIQHLVEKEKLVLAVEQEILRVHGRAERAVANQALPFSVCTILRDREVYNILAPEQEEKRNAQRSRCNGRQINSWLQEVDDKWEKIKEGMLRRQHTEAETLHAVQLMSWEWKLKELNLVDFKTAAKIEPSHVPQIHVSNFDLPA